MYDVSIPMGLADMVFPLYFWILFAAALLISAIGFKKNSRLVA